MFENLMLLLVVMGAGGGVLWMVRDGRRQQTKWKRAERELPILAQRLGLVFEPARAFAEIGVLDGVYDGHRVRISPDDHKVKIRLWLNGSLSSEGREIFNEPSPLFGLMFTTPELVRRWGNKLHLLNLDRNNEGFLMTCSPKDGVPDHGSNYAKCYVLPEHVEALLPLMTRVVRRFEIAPGTGA